LDSLLNDRDDDDMEKKTEKKTEILKFSFSPPLKIEKVLKILVQKGKDKNSPLWQEHGSLFVFVTLIHLIFTNDSDQWSAEVCKCADLYVYVYILRSILVCIYAYIIYTCICEHGSLFVTSIFMH
jgi:hypothetical protein